VQKHWDDLLDIGAVVLANLCVSYIMDGQNELVRADNMPLWCT
jgi:hypothetical protein